MRTRTIVFYLLILILFLYPLFYGYTSWFSLYYRLIFLWIVCFIAAVVYIDFRQKTNKKYKRLIFSAFLLILFWFIKDTLLLHSENIFFYTHKKTFNEIHNSDLDKKTSERIQKLSDENYFYDDYKVFKTKSITAIGINAILDNTDGFMFWNGKDTLPKCFFEGNLTFTEKIEGNWYKFSTR